MYATVVNQKLETHVGIPTLEQMQKVVGGYIETALRCPSPTRKNISVDVYCNEEGLMIDLPIQHIRLTDGSPLAGDLVIVGNNERTGNGVELTQDEIDAVLKYIIEVK